MNRSRGWSIVIVIVALLVLGSAGLAAESPPAPRTADPTLCHISGRNPEQLEALRAFVATSGPSRRSGLAPTALPEGPPADPATRAAIGATVDELFGCMAAGEAYRAILLASDARLVRGIEDPDEAVEFVAGLAAATPIAIPPQELSRAIYAGPWEVRQLADGRVSAAVWVDGEDEHPARGVTAIYLFVFEDGEWRLDDSFMYIYAVPPATPTDATKKRRGKEPKLVYVADLVGWPDIEPRSATPVP